MVNQHTTKGRANRDQQELLIPLWVTFEMVNQDGEWLLDRMVNEGEVASSTGQGRGGEDSEDPEGDESPSPDDTGGAGE
jgi:hypothetical protein